jgi:hypothetical protein
MKVKRAPFSIELSSVAGRPSVFADQMRAPAYLPRLVFLAPAPGSVCPPRSICIEQAPLKTMLAADVLISQGRSLSTAGAENLKKVIEKNGKDARVITSGLNFTNFEQSKTAGRYVYPITYIDGIPVEQFKGKYLRLVIFYSAAQANPQAIDFVPALVAVTEIEFLDADKI